MSIYLDFNATTPVDSEVQSEICSTLKDFWANPSSSYDSGKKAKQVIEHSRSLVAKMICGSPDEILFTSGGTESNHIVIHSILKSYQNEFQTKSDPGMEAIPHIITTNIEHDAIKLPLEVLSEEGKASVTFVPVSKKTGIVNVNDIINNIRPNTRLITVMLANNETGIIQPVSLIHDYLKSLKNNEQTIYLHTDAAQAIGKIDVDVESLGVDYLTIVGHKFYGPRIGALYFRKSCPLHPIFYGGGQERGYRPGTENTCMIAGLGKACELVTKNLEKYRNSMLVVKKYFKDSLKNKFYESAIINFKVDNHQLPNTLSVAFDYDSITGKILLDEASEIYASTGAACHSGGKPSKVLIASGVPESLASKTLRLSVGRETSVEDVDKAVECLHKAVLKLIS